jgi:alkylation response protein AidB-like acyl-CoA dehydrogenase
LATRPWRTTELHFDNFALSADNLIGGTEGHGFKHVMTGLEAERINLAARGLASRVPHSTKRSATRSSA